MRDIIGCSTLQYGSLPTPESMSGRLCMYSNDIEFANERFSSRRGYFHLLAALLYSILPIFYLSLLIFDPPVVLFIGVIEFLLMLQLESMVSQGVLCISLKEKHAVFIRVKRGRCIVLKMPYECIVRCDLCGRVVLRSGEIIDYGVLNYSYCSCFVSALRKRIGKLNQ